MSGTPRMIKYCVIMPCSVFMRVASVLSWFSMMTTSMPVAMCGSASNRRCMLRPMVIKSSDAAEITFGLVLTATKYSAANASVKCCSSLSLLFSHFSGMEIERYSPENAFNSSSVIFFRVLVVPNGDGSGILYPDAFACRMQ